MSPRNDIALITGAGSGIGRAVALALQADGYSVVLAGRTPDSLQQTAAAMDSSGGRTLVCPADVSEPAAVDNLFAETAQTFGRLDLLFNNAGLWPPAIPIEDLSYEEWQEAVNVNLTGSFLCAQAAIRLMKSQNPRGGRIINNGSISADAPRPHSAPYTATKHAITGLTKSIALDGRAYDVACSQIDIGNATTDMTETMAAGILQADGSLQAEPRMEIRHVADAVLYMAHLPLDANVPFMTLMATKMPLVGRG
ncbi:MAG: SDR family oxidoreductase [Rhodospirillaceae bacterium]|jgi:NAD(P)-dependent dehydrogenase (short-subunit alcohol dehydrogenase family)|nr:SDR family oxidoreductase [Rhodospirillaceae bacterium]MBT5458459.1 SDR family oxidoreductase [Rhodospirillaceae bacterium]